jgi:hypothetical protein
MREAGRTSTGVWYEGDGGGFFQLPHPLPAPPGGFKTSVEEQMAAAWAYLRERYGTEPNAPFR